MSNKKRVFVYEADHINSIIYVDRASMKRAGQIDSPEFREFTKIKEILPGYRLEEKDFPKTNKQTYNGLTIRVMQAFIIQYEDNTDIAIARLAELNKAKAAGLLNGSAYSSAKSWFLSKYSDAYNGSDFSKKDSKRDALIKSLLATVDSALINPTADMSKKGVPCNG